jgi:hypothetical protein
MQLASEAVAALQAAGFVGVWDTDVPAGRSVLDAGAAAMLAGNPGLAGQPLALETALGRIHPDDRDWVFGKIRRVRQTGGPVSLEFRVVSDRGDVRWILNRGFLGPDASGTLHGRGAYLDVTDLYARAARPPDGLAPMRAGDLEAAADHCIDAHAALDRYGDPYLQTVSGMLLLGIGRTLAQRQA